MTGSGKSLHLHTKSEFNFIAQDNSYTKDLSIHSVSTVQCCFSGGLFADPVMSRLREWRLWRAPVGESWAETAAIAPWTSPRHARCLVAIPGGHNYSKVSLRRFSLLPPHHPPTPLPSHPLPCFVGLILMPT